MPIIYAPPLIIHNSDDSGIEVEICHALPTKAETLVCLQKLKAKEDFEGTVAGGGLILLIVIVVVWLIKL